MGRPPLKTNATFLGVFESAITEKAEKGAPGSITRSTDNGEKHEFHYPYWESVITNIKYHENEYQGKMIKSWNVYLTDEEGEQFILSVSYASGYANSFYKMARNINFDEPVKIMPYCFEDDKTKKVKKGFTFYQGSGDDAKIKNYWTRENLPQAVKKKDKKTGKEAWDFSAVNEKLEDDFTDLIKATFKSGSQSSYSTPEQTEPGEWEPTPDAGNAPEASVIEPNENADAQFTDNEEDDMGLPF